MMRFGHFLSTARCFSSANVIKTPNPGPSPVMGKGGEPKGLRKVVLRQPLAPYGECRRDRRLEEESQRMSAGQDLRSLMSLRIKGLVIITFCMSTLQSRDELSWQRVLMRIGIIAICTIVIVIAMPQSSAPQYNAKEGSPWTQAAVTATFDFDIPKDSAIYRAECDSVRKSFAPYYTNDLSVSQIQIICEDFRIWVECLSCKIPVVPGSFADDLIQKRIRQRVYKR